ncbi:MAG TPA: Ig-like domain-containing protein, partial [Cellvibrionaceae bacterium]|nr:Ig-like domain-containing protein [Cellvibrionaceae bacterium]
MKNSQNPSAVFNLATTPAGSLSLALCVAFASQGAWSATCPTRPACNVSQNNFSGNLAAGQSLCISGTFTGNINNLAAGATIYVPAGATFNPASIQNPAGSIINCGSASLPSITLNTGFNFSNHGTADFKSNINWNGKGTFFNDAGAKINLRTTFQMKGNSTITNDGEILSSGDFSSEPGTSITNTGYIRLTGGNFNPDGTVVNSGFVQTDEFININPNSELINNCSFISQKGFNNNSPKTRNNGYIFVTGVGNNNDLVQNNKPFTQGPNAVVVGTRFFNNGAITGGGKYYFTGDTRNQAAFGEDGGGINFYDTTRTSGKIFDSQAPNPHSSVTANAFVPPTTDAVVTSCSRNVAPVKPVITINIIAGDDIINAQEDDNAVAISGATTDAPNGSLIQLEINGKTYSGTVSNNSWNILIPAADAQLFDASEIASAQVSLADNSASSDKATRTVAHTTELPSINIDIVAGDDIINTTEDDTAVTVKGTTSLAENGSTVKALINGKQYSASVSNNSWQFNLPAVDAQALKADEIITATVTNAAGNTSQPASRPIKHSTALPSVTIDVVAGDDIINAQEDDTNVVISGTSQLAENGSSVSFTLNGKNYTATVNNNTWSTSIPAADAQALRPSETITARVTNLAGDTSLPANRTIAHNFIIPTLSINTIAGDDIINLTEDNSAVTISGTTTNVENGQTVTLQVNGKNYSAQVNNNIWVTNMPAADAQALAASNIVNGQVVNLAGNSALANRSVKHSLAEPSVDIDLIAGDDIINTEEDNNPVLISGSTTLVENGQSVKVTLNGKNYSATVNNNSWQFFLPAVDAQALRANERVTATATNLAGDVSEPASRDIQHSQANPSIKINTVAGDDIINSTEDDLPVIISGTTTLVENGRSLSLVINGKNYSALVNNNAWSVAISAQDAQALDASEIISADVSNNAGDKASATRSISHSTQTPSISINTIAGDDIINASEDDSAVIISGTTSLVENGAVVAITLNGKNYTATVNNNLWSMSLPALDAQALGALDKVVARVVNNAGDEANAERPLSHSGTAPTISINIIAGDDIINTTEDDAAVVISGKTTLIEDGQKVTLIINGKTYEAVVTNNTWSTQMPATDAQALKAAEKVTASTNNKAGDKALGERAINHSLIAPTISISPIAGDDIINATEDDAPVLISGTTTLVEDGATLTVTVNGKNYSALVSNNSWSISMPALDAQALSASEIVKAEVSNKAGDKATAERAISHAAIAPTLSINAVAGDDIINASEDDAPVLISGKTTSVEDGAKLSLTLNGKNYEAVVNNNAWSISLPASDAQALDASELVAAKVSNKAGDLAEASRTISHSGTAPSIIINVIAGDDIINTSEDDASVVISGTTTLVEDGQAVQLSINGKNYLAIVTNNTWSTAISPADAQALKAAEIVSAQVTNKAGDKADATRSISHSVSAPSISISPIAGDDIINTSEDDAAVVVSGKTTLVEDGAKVVLTINGKQYEAIVSNNNWSLLIPAIDAQALDATELVSAQVINKAGDKASTERTITHSGTAPTISINTVAGDDIINTLEDDNSVTISGTTSLVEDGRAVELSLNGKNYIALVTNNSWSTDISAADAQALKAAETISAKVSNKAGDSANTNRAITHSLAAPTISINPIAGDDIINAAEDDQPVTISGKTTLVEDGAKVVISINGKTYEATVSNNSWAIALPAADAQALDASETVNAQVINKAGDKANTERALTHSGTAPTLSINIVAGDDIINTTEDDSSVTISGVTTLVEDGQAVQLTLNGKNYLAVVNNNQWSTAISPSDAQALNAAEKIAATVNNKAGDSANADRA